MEAIESMGRELTILIIAHRLTTLKNCDRIYRLEKASISNSGTPDQVLNNKAENAKTA